MEAALAAAELGATALHDPTEGGLAGGFTKWQERAGSPFGVDTSRIAWLGPATMTFPSGMTLIDAARRPGRDAATYVLLSLGAAWLANFDLPVGQGAFLSEGGSRADHRERHL